MYLLRAPESMLINEPLDLSIADLQHLYALDEAAPIVRANLVISLDGHITGSDHRSQSLSTPGSLRSPEKTCSRHEPKRGEITHQYS